MSDQLSSPDTPEKAETIATPIHQVVQLADDQIQIDDLTYRVVFNHKDGFDPEALSTSFIDLLTKYDYIVGDWGFEQLRLRGFYADGHKHANRDQYISTLMDYIYEFCNFGCAYFVLERLSPAPAAPHIEPAPRNRPKLRRPVHKERRERTRRH
ncbi:MAG: YutD family protein [Schleiferilactobacillus perolens]|jgi:uncharacterized protein YutD|uniref:Transcriptional regulator n=1 Tax=Schleiferilactobacillus perolens DSM 12744 TaxID=1423792 RepID=A0A0R1MKI9_9LACO|nr:YutD family protein [Schleiferilactobacillus perolens]KRL08487.1 hypothetical protein FD09_GL001588 [Schleiferilactobacillus perolens DSM 12744]MCI1891262.1 YutD family protein [Schleiferilactobacillus harbinensis]MCI1912700.1 YutD family protein [Schleiferilactobacillus harbinensis]